MVEPEIIKVAPTGGAHVFGEVGRLPEVATGAVKVTVIAPVVEFEVMAVAATVKVTGP